MNKDSIQMLIITMVVCMIVGIAINLKYKIDDLENRINILENQIVIEQENKENE